MVSALRYLIFVGLLVVSVPAKGSAQKEVYWQVFGAQMTDNEWGDLFDDWGSVSTRNAAAVGGGVMLEYRLWRLGHIGLETQVLKWFGEQDHLEFTLPLYLRSPRLTPVWLPSLTYGLGLSYATEPSQSEIERTGSSNELLAHWFFELEFGNAETRFRPYLRLHHRSDAWGTFDADTGSNAILFGIRSAF